MELNHSCTALTVFLPSGLKESFDNYMLFNPPDFKFKSYVDHFYYIFAKIYGVANGKPRFKNLDKVPISSTILMNELGRHYKRYIDYLLEGGFIDTDNHYIVSDKNVVGKCKCYCITEPYKSIKTTERVKISSKSIVGHYIRWKEEMFSKVADDNMLSKLFDMVQKFHIDTDEATKYLLELQETDPKITDEWIKNELKKCECINNKDETASKKLMFIIRDPYNRIHTNLTNLSKHIRENFLYVGGEKVKSIDIVSSQASLLYLLMREERNKIESAANNPNVNQFVLDQYVPGSDVRDKYVNSRNSYTGEHILHPIVAKNSVSKLGKTTYFETLSCVDSELIEIQRTLKAGIYEFFQNQWYIRFGVALKRDQIKKKWISYVFGKPGASCKKMRSIWESTFPMLSKIMDNFKKNDYRVLAHTLQKTEADLVFNKVCKSIDDNLGIAYGTVHDSLLVPATKYEEAKELFCAILDENGIVTGVK